MRIITIAAERRMSPFTREILAMPVTFAYFFAFLRRRCGRCSRRAILDYCALAFSLHFGSDGEIRSPPRHEATTGFCQRRRFHVSQEYASVLFMSFYRRRVTAADVRRAKRSSTMTRDAPPRPLCERIFIMHTASFKKPESSRQRCRAAAQSLRFQPSLRRADAHFNERLPPREAIFDYSLQADAGDSFR